MRVWLDGGVNDGIGGRPPQIPPTAYALVGTGRVACRSPPLRFVSADRFPHGPQSFAGGRLLFTRDQAADGVQPAAHPHHYAPQRRARRRGPSPTRRLELRPQTPPNRDAESMSWAVHRCSRCARQRKQAVRAKSSQNRQKTVGLRVYAFCGACGAGGGGSNAQLRIKTALVRTSDCR